VVTVVTVENITPGGRMSAVPAPNAMPVFLRDGRTVRIRALTSSDASALHKAIDHADGFDLYRRFMGTPPPTHVLLRLLRSADGVHDAVLGAFAGNELTGVAQFDRADEAPTAELAIEVATSWQRCGLGSALLAELCALACSRGITCLTAYYFTDNTPLVRLLVSTGRSRWIGSECGATSAELDLK
jgi:RimJ/RimL family protein N-acetyltransferase